MFHSQILIDKETHAAVPWVFFEKQAFNGDQPYLFKLVPRWLIVKVFGFI